MNLTSGNVSRYLQSSLCSVNSDLLHDGRWLSFLAGGPGRPVEVMATRFQPDTPAKEGDWIKVVRDQHYNDKPRGPPDGNRIYFTSDSDGFTCL